jgi:hypothetical protein
VSFVLLVVSAAVVVVSSWDLDVRTEPLWVSVGLSIAAIAAAIAAIALPRRR